MATTTQFGPDFLKDLIPQMLKSADVETKKIYHALWDAFMFFLMQHWIEVIVVAAIILFVALVIAYMGRWGMLGRVLYHYLYFGILFAIGLIKGPKVFVSEYFEIVCGIILYPLCYKTVGIILDKLGVRRRF